MSILARDKVPPKTVKANINIPHCRGIPTKLPNQSHSRVVSKRLYKQKGEERRKEGKTGGGTEKKKKRRRRRGKCPPTEQRSAASSTVQGESSAKRDKGTKKELPRVGKQAPGFVCPRIFHRVLDAHALETNPRVYLHEGWRESGNLWMILCIASCRGSHRVIVTSWKPDTGRDPFCSSHSSVSRIGRCVLFDYAFILRILFEWRAKFYVYLYIATQWLKSGICNNVTRK